MEGNLVKPLNGRYLAGYRGWSVGCTIAEVSADRAIDHGGVYRHPLRSQRLRLDATVDDVPDFGQGAAATG
ncbi:hypothetical protein Snoj_25680 [Streptomyces nojiriensis]|uniref:Uncharacterized protein n=1 Tax=Streptomyces nojiriensis TaxID=66374 RepID=A0ABQ3SKI6_9ACTN|nr:hypothetical protein [Streptomyces nojiriensis]QTI50242.1 hypothetical protein JYK04_08118 [Streptomyces nojiriensis]GGS29355.1 hypothetical protein GCM10010205_69280 [Streptomyces nojiriensis]GHI68650.1 hypothetical protein Snoj_25680 [Streptomyces nojiriensis]